MPVRPSAVPLLVISHFLILVACRGERDDIVKVRVPIPESAGGSWIESALSLPMRYVTTQKESQLDDVKEQIALRIPLAQLPALIEVRPPASVGEALVIQIEAARLGETSLARRQRARLWDPESKERVYMAPADVPPDMDVYRYRNRSPNALAYFFDSEAGEVFVDCAKHPHCFGFTTWSGLMDVRYHYVRASMDDTREWNTIINKLIRSFHPQEL